MPYGKEELFTGTWAEWCALTPQERKRRTDTSGLHQKLIGLEGKHVRVYPKRKFGRSTFRVGKSTGWKPVHLAVSRGAVGSSDVIAPEEHFERVDVLGD